MSNLVPSVLVDHRHNLDGENICIDFRVVRNIRIGITLFAKLNSQKTKFIT